MRREKYELFRYFTMCDRHALVHTPLDSQKCSSHIQLKFTSIYRN